MIMDLEVMLSYYMDQEQVQSVMDDLYAEELGWRMLQYTPNKLESWGEAGTLYDDLKDRAQSMRDRERAAIAQGFSEDEAREISFDLMQEVLKEDYPGKETKPEEKTQMQKMASKMDELTDLVNKWKQGELTEEEVQKRAEKLDKEIDQI
jgi:hypothetical protein